MDEVFEPYSPRNAADPRWIDVTELLADEVTELDVLEHLEAQFVPMDRQLWELDRFDDFLAARRQLLAQAMNQVLEG